MNELKVCSVCKQEKPLSDFNKNKRKSDGLQTQCKDCSRKLSREYYDKNKDYHYNSTKNRKIKQIELAQEFVLMYLKTHPCIDCNESDPIVLEFDHVLGSKRNSICRMIHAGYSIESIMKEIEKCEVRCANCHRRKTAAQFVSFKYQMTCDI